MNQTADEAERVRHGTVIAIGTTVLVIDGAAAVLAPPIDIWYLLHVNSGQIPLESGAALIAVVTFIGIWLMQIQRSAGDAVADMRSAIAGTFVMLFLVVFSWVAFFPPGYAEGSLGLLSTTFITHYMILTGVVVGFYFVSSAAIRIAVHWKSGAKIDAD